MTDPATERTLRFISVFVVLTWFLAVGLVIATIGMMNDLDAIQDRLEATDD